MTKLKDGRGVYIYCVICRRRMGRTGRSQCEECRTLRERIGGHGEREHALATVRRLYALAQRAKAGLPLFHERRNDRE